MKVYQITKRENTPNVFGISLVASPAMESDYVRLSKEKTDDLTTEQKIELSKQYDIQLKDYKKDKRLLLGLVLEPNKLIYRYNEQTQEEYYITVSEETILELQQQYIEDSNQKYSTLEHDGRELDGVIFTEHWIVEDSKIDKSALHGMNFKKGSWVAVAKIKNDTLWNDYIETGSVMGFSIDAMVHLEEINLNKQKEKMSETKTILDSLKDLKNQIALAFEPKKKEEKKYEDMTPEEKAEYDKIKKAKEGVAMSEQEDTEAHSQAVKEISLELSKLFKEEVSESLKPLEATNLELAKKVEDLEAKTVSLKAELDEKPTSQPIRTAPTQVDFSKMTNKEKMEYNQRNKR